MLCLKFSNRDIPLNDNDGIPQAGGKKEGQNLKVVFEKKRADRRDFTARETWILVAN